MTDHDLGHDLGHSHAHDHEHGDGHDHSHDHAHGEEENPGAGQGAVVLDIGGDIGALVVIMPVETVGQEVEILPAGTVGRDEPAHRPHVAVVDREAPAGRVPSLVYPDLREGRYDLMPKGTDDVRLTVDVRGGEVTTTAWPV